MIDEGDSEEAAPATGEVTGQSAEDSAPEALGATDQPADEDDLSAAPPVEEAQSVEVEAATDDAPAEAEAEAPEAAVEPAEAPEAASETPETAPESEVEAAESELPPAVEPGAEVTEREVGE
jgi:hypothetical protein